MPVTRLASTCHEYTADHLVVRWSSAGPLAASGFRPIVQSFGWLGIYGNPAFLFSLILPPHRIPNAVFDRSQVQTYESCWFCFVNTNSLLHMSSITDTPRNQSNHHDLDINDNKTERNNETSSTTPVGSQIQRVPMTDEEAVNLEKRENNNNRPAFSVYTLREKWMIIAIAALAGLFRWAHLLINRDWDLTYIFFQSLDC